MTEQKIVADTLKGQIINHKIGHSYIFFGSRWIWKTTTARIIAKWINCLTPVDGNPCTVCTNCVLIDSNKTMDVVEIDAASNTWVDNVRDEIISKSVYPPSQLKYKVYIIDEVHMLSKNAFNALLKIMEEPPAHLVFLLATTELHKVPETIVSRCQVFNLRRISQQWIIDRLKYICEKEKFTYEDGALELIARVVDGWMRDALKYLEQLSTFGNITYWLAEQMLWVTSSQTLSNLLSNYVKQDWEAMNQTINQLNHQWSDANAVIKDLVRYIDTNSSSFEDIKKNAWLLWVCFEYLRTSRWQSFPWLYFSYLLSEHTK